MSFLKTNRHKVSVREFSNAYPFFSTARLMLKRDAAFGETDDESDTVRNCFNVLFFVDVLPQLKQWDSRIQTVVAD